MNESGEFNEFSRPHLTPARRIAYELQTAAGMVSASGMLARCGAPHGSPVAPMINALLLFVGVGWAERVEGQGQRANYRWVGDFSLSEIGAVTWESMEAKVSACFKPEAVAEAVAEKKAEPAKPTIAEQIQAVLTAATTKLTRPQLHTLLPGMNSGSINTTLNHMRHAGQIKQDDRFEVWLTGRDLPASAEPLAIMHFTILVNRDSQRLHPYERARCCCV
jgi:hypothetical protein